MTQLHRILVLDENDHDRELLRKALESAEACYEVLEASSRSEFENLLEEGFFNLVVSDIEVEGYKSLQVIDELKERFPRLPVIIATSRDSEEIAVESMRRGASDYVKKSPENIRNLPLTVKRILGEVHSQSQYLANDTQLKKIIRNSVDMLAIVDEHGTEKFVSDSVEEIFGYTSREILGSNCFTYVHPDDLGRMQQAFDEVVSNPGVSLRGEYRHRTKDGNWLKLEAVGTNFLDDPDIRGIVLNIRDITVHKQLEESLRKSRAHLDKLVSNSNDILVIMDENGKELYVSETIEKVTGFSAEEVIGTDCFDHFHPDDIETISGKLQELISNPGKSDRVEYRRRKKGGGWVYLEAIGTNFLDDPDISGIVVNARDITDRRNAEESLRRSGERMDKLVRHSNDLLLILDADGKELYVSESIERLTGYTSDEILGTICFDYFHPDDMEKMKKIREQLLAYPDKLQRVEYRRKNKNGGWIYLEAICSNHLDDPDIQGIVINARDITERKKVDKKLLDSRERYRRLASLLPEAVWEADLEGRVSFINEKGLDLLGYTREDIDSGLNGFDFFAMTGRQLCMEKTMAVLKGGKTEITEYEMLRKDGSTFPGLVHSDLVSEEGKPVSFIGIGIDITEHKQSELELRRLATAIEQSSETIVITDPDGIIQYVNPSFERTTGYSRKEAIGKNPRVLKSGQHSSAFYKSLWRVLLKGEPWHGRFTNQRKDGDLYNEDATISPVLNEAGEVINYVAVKRDITEYLKALDETLKMEEKFQQAQKMESVGLLAGGVAHDLNNLLTPILGYGEMLASNDSSPKASREFAHGIVEAGKKARDIVNQLLAFSRKQSLEIKAVDLNLLVSGFKKMLRRLISEEIEINVKTISNLPSIMGDSSQLEQVILNLAVNARDAMPEGGILSIETAIVEIDENSLQRGENLVPGIYAMMAVSDTGIGMDAGTMTHIFEPFFSTKPKHKGSGLGLATVYGIVRQHGGDVEVQSEPDKGSTFKIFLPVSLGDSVLAEEVTLVDEQELHGSESILLVEDDDHVRNLVLSILGRKGYKVLTAESGEQALEIMASLPDSIDLLLTDVVMPGINGKELYDQISPLCPEMKVIYMSGYSGEVIAARGVMDESVNFIQKPFSVQALAAKIRSVLEKKKQ
jgi:PAS domain S-box-containing protein